MAEHPADRDIDSRKLIERANNYAASGDQDHILNQDLMLAAAAIVQRLDTLNSKLDEIARSGGRITNNQK